MKEKNSHKLLIIVAIIAILSIATITMFSTWSWTREGKATGPLDSMSDDLGGKNIKPEFPPNSPCGCGTCYYPGEICGYDRFGNQYTCQPVHACSNDINEKQMFCECIPNQY